MAKNKLTIEFEGFNILRDKLNQLGGDVKKATEKALEKSQKAIEQKVSAAIMPHNESGETAKSIVKNAVVEWTGEMASVNVGFDIKDGGLPSIFLMYGTKVHGQPHITPDKNLYNAVYGAQTRKEIAKIQEQIFTETIERVMEE